MTNHIVTAIDMGTSKIATLIAKISEDEKTPRIMGFASVSAKGIKRGQIIDIKKVTDTIEESVEKAERMAGHKINHAYISIGGPHINSINSHGVVAVHQPEVEITEEDITRAIEAAKAISLSSNREVIEIIPREYVVDGQDGIKNPLGMTGVRLEVNTHIITAGLTNLRNTERCLSDLGIDIERIIFTGLASSLSAISETEKELGVVLVDIGGGKTDICVYIEGALSYSSTIAIGARHITNDIAVGLRVSLDSAEKIKLFLVEKTLKKHDIIGKKDDIDIKHLSLPEGLSSISYKAILEGIIKPRLEEIFEKIYTEIDASGFISLIPSGLVITGGGAQTIGTIQSAKKAIGLSARIGIPQGVTGLIDEILYPQYAAVVGLLLYTIDNKGKPDKAYLKNFSHFFKNLTFKNSWSKIINTVKSFMP